jgi:putative acetyltransferase
MTAACGPEITVVSGAPDIEAVRSLWREYWEGLGLPLDFQNFAAELRTLPGAYAPPEGRLLIARIQGEPAGSAAFRPLSVDSCEAKRLYVRPEHRRRGIASALLHRLIAEARGEGYAEIYADTLPTMKSALQMYSDFGFVEVGPYSRTPTPDAIFLKLRF